MKALKVIFGELMIERWLFKVISVCFIFPKLVFNSIKIGM